MGCGGCASANERCGNGLEKIYPTTAVRYGRMKHIGEFSHAADLRFTCGAGVVISTERGIEIGHQVSLTCFGCEKSVSRDQMRAYAEASGSESYRLKSGRILREATPEDLAEWRHIENAAFDKLQSCRRISVELGLQMRIVDCEHLFGGERIIFYFMAEERVDFRQLVHRLASEFQTRIEMRQVGARDEARLVADYETCGRECCCRSFLKTLKPVSMSMAKLQKTTLDLSKVSGRCGRLKCCLRYEHETYESLDKKLPRVGMRIRTAHGIGQIVDRQVLTQLVKIRTDDEKLISVVVEDILETNLPAPNLPPRSENSEEARPRGRRGRGLESRPPRPAPPAGQPPRAAPPLEAPEAPPGVPGRPEGQEPGEPPADAPQDPQAPRRSRRGRRRRRRGQGRDAGGSPGPTPPGDGQ